MLTILCNVLQVTCFLITQQLFIQDSFYRTLSLNSTYLWLLKSPRDSSAIMTIAKNYSPYNSSWVTAAFQKATEEPHRYILNEFLNEFFFLSCAMIKRNKAAPCYFIIHLCLDFSYLLFNFSQSAPEILRLMSNILPSESKPIKVYVKSTTN